MRTVRVFVSSPGDTHFERMRVERVVERLNGEFAGIARLEAIRWEGKHYKAHATFQQQIPEASACDIVVAILRHRLGTELPDDFPTMPNGKPYPSGTAYEILSAIEASKTKSVPDVYVFRYGEPPTVRLDDESTNRLVTEQWEKLKGFFKTWFQTAEGKFKLAFHTFPNTDAFEAEIDTLLRTWLEEKILKGRSVLWPVDIKGSPFRGLAAFGAKHAPVFFGRSRDITKAVDALKDAGERGTPFLLVVGASGAGKSSLALAGLEPRLTAPGVVPSVDLWRVAVMRPGEHAKGPVAGLAAAVFQKDEDLDDDDVGRHQALPEIATSDYGTPEELGTLFAHADETCAKPIVRALDRVAEAEAKESGHDRAVRADLLIVVDQLDELFAGTVSDEERARFAKLLSLLVATGRVWVITTLRADLYERFLKEPDLLALKTKGATYDLAPPGAAEIDEIIHGPAEAAGLVYETDDTSGERLDERLIRDIDRPDMLPLLQFTLNFLFEKRVTADGETKLTLKAYDELGGLAGAIDREGERAIAGLGKEERERLPRLLRQLAAPAHLAEGGTPTAAASGGLSIVSVPFEAAAYDPPSERLVRALVDARILLSSGGEAKATIRLAHQRVLENWRRAKEIVAANAEFYRIRDDVEGLRRRWDKANKARDLLIPKGVPLAEAESIANRYPGELAPPTLAFIATSGKRARFRQRLVGASAVVFALLAAGATAAGVLALRAERQAQQNLAVAQRNFKVANELVTDIARGLRNVEGMNVASRKKIFDEVSKTLDRAVAEAPDDAELLGMQATMFEQFASTHMAEGEAKLAAESSAKSLEIKLRIEEKLRLSGGAGAGTASGRGQADVSSTLEQIGDLKLKAADDAGALAVYEQILANRRARAAEASGNADLKRDVAATLDTIGEVKQRAGDAPGAIAAYAEAAAIRREVAVLRPDNADVKREHAFALSDLAYAKKMAGDLGGATDDLVESLAVVQALAEADARNETYAADVAAVLVSIGDVGVLAGANDEALDAYEKSLKIRQKLADAAKDDPYRQRDLASSLSGIGDAKLAKGDREGALDAYVQGADIMRAVVAKEPGNMEWRRDLSVSLNRLGDVKRDSGDTSGALAAYEESLRIREALAAGDEATAQAKTDAIYVLQRIGDVKRGAGDNAGALAAYARSLDIMRALAESEPDNANWQREVSVALTKVGAAHKAAGANTEALAALEDSIAIRRKLPKTDASKWALDVAENLEPIGDIKLAAGDNAGALAAYEEMLGIDRDLTAANTANLSWQRNLALSLNRLGDVKKSTGDTAGALAAYEESLEVRRRLLGEGKTIQRQQDVALNLEKIGDLKRDAGDLAAALSLYEEMLGIDREVTKIEPETQKWQRNMAISLARVGDAKRDLKNLADALAVYEESIAIRRKLLEAEYNDGDQREIGNVLEKIADIKAAQGDQAAALATYLDSEKERRALAQTQVNAGNDRGALSAYEQALAVARKAEAAEPGNAAHRDAIARNLHDMAGRKVKLRDPQGALADYEESLGIRRQLAQDKKDLQALQNVAATLEKVGDLKRDQGDGAAALAAYEEMLANDRKFAAEIDNPDWQRNLGYSLERIGKVKLDAGDRAGAIALYEESLTIRRTLVKAVPRDERYRQDLAATLEWLGDVKRNGDDAAGALALYEETLGVNRGLAADNIGDAQRQRTVSINLNKIVDLKLKLDDTQGALAAGEESLAIARHLARVAPDNLDWQRDVSISLERIGNIQTKLGDKRAALRAYEEMLSIDRKTSGTEPDNPQWKRDVRFSLNKLGDARAAIEDYSGALANYDEGLAVARKLLADDDPQSQRDLAYNLDKVGEMKAKLGDADGALAAHTESLAVARGLAAGHEAEPGPQIDLVVKLYKFAGAAKGTEKEAAIKEGLDILAKLDAAGQLDDTQKGWSESFLTLRNGGTP